MPTVCCKTSSLSFKTGMLSIENILEDCDDVSFRESFVRIGVFLSNKIFPFLTDDCTYVTHSFLWNNVEPIILICHLVLSGNSCEAEGTEVKGFNAITEGEGPWLYVLSQIFRICQNPHLIHPTTGVANITVTLPHLIHPTPGVANITVSLPHLIHPTHGVANITVTLKPDLDHLFIN